MNFKVGDLIYDPAIYDGMNTNIGDLAFYKKWLPKFSDGVQKQIFVCC